MAKSKNRDRSQHKPRTGQGEQPGAGDTTETQQRPAASPADVARKHQRRFGHN